ncbi:translation initiation factor IF-2-like [Eublepharis macularius]|uniref:Translation initiation factor IF-2-like n=1 Tax=Eublepharis macularius TaxID=481883 RepID=A0AA97LGV7_EUBMA|nr:translation initiation factor IF-2-like [Eublepharis macularius]
MIKRKHPQSPGLAFQAGLASPAISSAEERGTLRSTCCSPPLQAPFRLAFPPPPPGVLDEVPPEGLQDAHPAREGQLQAHFFRRVGCRKSSQAPNWKGLRLALPEAGRPVEGPAGLSRPIKGQPGERAGRTRSLPPGQPLPRFQAGAEQRRSPPARADDHLRSGMGAGHGRANRPAGSGPRHRRDLQARFPASERPSSSTRAFARAGAGGVSARQARRRVSLHAHVQCGPLSDAWQSRRAAEFLGRGGQGSERQPAAFPGPPELRSRPLPGPGRLPRKGRRGAAGPPRALWSPPRRPGSRGAEEPRKGKAGQPLQTWLVAALT